MAGRPAAREKAAGMNHAASSAARRLMLMDTTPQWVIKRARLLRSVSMRQDAVFQ
jgi:hypothetical protein